jgi:hypothetical protein
MAVYPIVLEGIMVGNESSNKIRLIGIIVISTVIICAIGLHFLSLTLSDSIAGKVSIIVVFALGFMSMSFCLGLFINRMPS